MSKHKKIFIDPSTLDTGKPKILVNPQERYLESKVRFSLKLCDTRSHCIRCLDRAGIQEFYSKLGWFEDMKWRDARNMPREKGFSVEKKSDENHKRLSDMQPGITTFAHFRVPPDKCRVFGGFKDDLFYIIAIDKDGKWNHN